MSRCWFRWPVSGILSAMAAQYPYSLTDALRLFGWVGPPAVVYRGALLDGRRRAAVAESLGLSIAGHSVAATTAREAARRLVGAGHYERAGTAGLLPFDARDSASCLAWLGMVRPNQAMAGRRVHEPRIRAVAIERLIGLLDRATARGDDSIPCVDIREVVARWRS
jgi:hypothetical protein